MNFKHTIKKISVGDLTRRVALRKTDYLKEEGRQINNMIDGLTRLVSDLRSDHLKLISALKEFAAPLEDLPSRKAVEERLHEARHQAELVLKDISQFKFENEAREP